MLRSFCRLTHSSLMIDLLLLGPKGTGKTSMVTEAMVNNSADGIAMFEAHEDAEVVRLRLGKALDFEYSEVSIPLRPPSRCLIADPEYDSNYRILSRDCFNGEIHVKLAQSSILNVLCQSWKRWQFDSDGNMVDLLSSLFRTLTSFETTMMATHYCICYNNERRLGEFYFRCISE